MKSEKTNKPNNGYVMLTIVIILIAIILSILLYTKNAGFLFLGPIVIFFIPGFFIVNPNSSRVLVLLELTKERLKKMASFGPTRFIPNRKFL